MADFDGSKTGTFEPYRAPSKWQTLAILILLMAGAIGLLVFLLRL